MKRLILSRHAKSSWDDGSLADFDRPLNERGLAVAPFMGRHLAERGLIPDSIVSSPAKRAAQTAKLLKKGAVSGLNIKFDHRIYEASPHVLSQVAAEFDDAADSVMMVGHNPGCEGFIALLTGRMERMPTGAIAIIDLDIESWADLEGGIGTIAQMIRPRDVMQAVDCQPPQDSTDRVGSS